MLSNFEFYKLGLELENPEKFIEFIKNDCNEDAGLDFLDFTQLIVYVACKNIEKDPYMLNTLKEVLAQEFSKDKINDSLVRNLLLIAYNAVENNLVELSRLVEFLELLISNHDKFFGESYGCRSRFVEFKLINIILRKYPITDEFRLKIYDVFRSKIAYVDDVSFFNDALSYLPKNPKIISEFLINCFNFYSISIDEKQIKNYIDFLIYILKNADPIFIENRFYYYYKHLPIDRFSDFLNAIAKDEDLIERLKNELPSNVFANTFLVILGHKEKLEITKGGYDELKHILPYLSKEDFFKLFGYIDRNSKYSAVFLNNASVTENENVTERLLKLYLSSNVKERKMENPLVLLNEKVISKLSKKELYTLVLRSFKIVNGCPVLSRFTFTEEALKTIKEKLMPLVISGGIKPDVFSAFLSAHKKANAEESLAEGDYYA